MQELSYFRPDNLEQAVEFLSKNDQVTLWAGGTDLVVKVKSRKKVVSKIVDLKGVKELKYIQEDDPVRIGALSSIYEIESSRLIEKEFPVLAQAAHALGSWQIRSLATIGGNLANGAPSAETAPPILVLNGTLVARGKNGERVIQAEQFFKGPGQTALEADEILTEIKLPKVPVGSKSIYLKYSLRRSMDIALVGIACLIEIRGNKCIDIRLGLGAVAPVPMRAHNAEEGMKGRIMTDELVTKAAEQAATECQPIDDIRATAAYRRKMVSVLVKRALLSLWKEVGNT
ncbi:MAG: FAD binding domain-containing protein [Desulfitobacteriaceae bacterium]